MTQKVTVGSLIEKLSEYGADVEIRIMHQESYPLQEVIGGIWEPTAGDECRECGYTAGHPLHLKASEEYDHNFDAETEMEKGVLFLVANGHPRDEHYNVKPYGDKQAWENMERVS